jgi:hypothetical protein
MQTIAWTGERVRRVGTAHLSRKPRMPTFWSCHHPTLRDKQINQSNKHLRWRLTDKKQKEFPFKFSAVVITAFCRTTNTHPHTHNFCGRFFENEHVQFLSSCLYGLSSATRFCSVLISEKIYIDFTHRTQHSQGVIRPKGLYLHTTHKGINDRQRCTNVTIRRVCVTAVEVEKQVLQILCVCV